MNICLPVLYCLPSTGHKNMYNILLISVVTYIYPYIEITISILRISNKYKHLLLMYSEMAYVHVGQISR